MSIFTKEVLGLVAIIFPVIGFGGYFLSVLHNRIRPHIFTWIIWGIGTTSVFFAQFFNGAGPGCWATGCSGFITIAIAILCYHKKHHLDTEKSDFIFLLISLFALLFWYIMSNALYAVVILTIVDVCGYVPTIKKAFYKPFEESLISFTMSIMRNIVSLMSLTEYSVVTTLFQIVGLFACIFTISLILIRRFKLSCK